MLDALDERGLTENTLVIYASDNGPWLNYGDHAGTVGPLREGKGTTFEGGVRVPCLVRYPNRVPAARVSSTPWMTIDIFPTVARIIGADLPQLEIDGRDAWPLLSGEPAAKSPQPAYFFYYHKNHLEAVRSGPWKLHFPHGYRSMVGQVAGSGGTPGKYNYDVKTGLELYNLELDIGESRDVAAENPRIVERLVALGEEMRARLGDALTETVGSENREPGRIAEDD